MVHGGIFMDQDLSPVGDQLENLMLYPINEIQRYIYIYINLRALFSKIFLKKKNLRIVHGGTIY
jgi:hypothetical protein